MREIRTSGGMSSGLVNVGRMVGATLGVAILGLIFGPRIEEVAKNASQFLGGMRTTFLIGGIAQFVGVGIAVIWLRRDSLRTKEVVDGDRARKAPHRAHPDGAKRRA
jgi:hypothetical protein